MIKLLHTADWQIGKQFGQFEIDDATILADARFSVVERLGTLASERCVDAILVAGDVFDAQGVADKTIHRLFHGLATFNGPWIMIPGNHDAGLAESVWIRAARLGAIPPNAHVCLRPEPLNLPALGLIVLPAPLDQRNTYVDVTEWFARAPATPGMFRVGLAHGSVRGVLAEGIDSSNPIAAGRAEQAGLDYLALGDWHGTKQVDARTWYSGTPETDRFKANESGQALLVELTEPGGLPTTAPTATGRYRWRSEAIAVDVPSDVDGLVQQLGALTQTDVVQFTIAGQTDLAGQRRLLGALSNARARARGLVVDLSELRLEPTAEDLGALRADGYLGEVIADLRAAQDGPNADTARESLAILASILDERRAAAMGGAVS